MGRQFLKLLSMFWTFLNVVVGYQGVQPKYKNAYATMMYMGTPRDYEFYVATRVTLKSLAALGVQADRVVIASSDVPPSWVKAMEKEDGARVVIVQNLNNPYANVPKRFKLTLNKLYAWSLVDYERVVMLDSDNLFLQKTDELFQCGQFCAVFINPCIFHTGLFVLQPSMEVFKDLLHELEIGRRNSDGADQGFICSYFPDMLDQPMFHPPENGTKLDGHYRLPLGYQMDATYYYLRLHWNVPCGPNSVITFPGASFLKPWYWWSSPVLPLGIDWHERRRQTLGYGAEMPMVFIQTVIYLGVIVMARLARTNLSKLCRKRADKGSSLLQISFKLTVIWSILASYFIPIFFIPTTVHPLIGWSLYLLGSFALLSIAINAFLLPVFTALLPLIGILGALLVMAYPWYGNGINRAMAIFSYAFCCSPLIYVSFSKVMESLHVSLEKDTLLPRSGESSPSHRSSKLC